MKKNLGSADRIIRILVAAAIGALYFMGHLSGATAIALLALAAIFIATSFMGFCPVYWAVGLSSKKASADASGK